MKAVAVMVLLALPAIAGAFDVRPEISARGWFFSVDGEIEDTDLDALDFDQIQGQPEVHAGVTLAGRHHIDVSYLRVRRSEEGTAQGVVFGIFTAEQDIAIDLDVDYVRAHYGYSLFPLDLLELRPFLEVGFLDESTNIVNRDTGQQSPQSDFAVFPLPGLQVVVGPSLPVRLRARATGIGTGQGHLVDVEGGIEGQYRFAFGGLGYRHIDFRVENDDDQELADVALSGFYVQGGVRF